MRKQKIFFYIMILSIQTADAQGTLSKRPRYSWSLDVAPYKRPPIPQRNPHSLEDISFPGTNPSDALPTPINGPLFIILQGNRQKESPPSLFFKRDIDTSHENYAQISGLLGNCHESAIPTKESFYCQTNWMITSAYNGPVNSAGNFIVERPPDALHDHQGPRSSITALTAVAKDDTGETALHSGGMGAFEADIYADGLDTTGGAPNNRTLALLVIDSLHHGIPMSVSQGLLVGVNSDDAYYGKTVMLDGKFSTAAIDLRQTKPMCQTDRADSYCPPIIWMGDDMIVTYSSDGATTQKYNSHNGHLEFTVGGKKSLGLDARSGAGLFYHGLKIPDDQKIQFGNPPGISLQYNSENRDLEIRSGETTDIRINSDTGDVFFLKDSHFQSGLHAPNYPGNDTIWTQRHADGFLVNNTSTHQLFIQENGTYRKLLTAGSNDTEKYPTVESPACKSHMSVRVLPFKYLPSRADLGETVFCPDCYSGLRPPDDPQTGINVTFNGSRWNDAVGLATRHK